MAFFLFLLVNATLFIRPAEIIPDLLGFNIYLVLIVLCLGAAIPELLAYFTERSLDRQPIALCVLGLQVVVIASNLAVMPLGAALEGAFDFFKVVIYFFLFVSLVNTPDRLYKLMAWLLVCVLVMSLMPVLQYHQLINLPNLRKLVEIETDSVTGLQKTSDRLQGSGIFQDPNDLCVMLAAMIPLALFFLTNPKNYWTRILSVAGLVVFTYVILKTQSRGGMLAVLGGLGAFTWARFGFWRSLPLGLLILPALLLLGGRQTDFNLQQGTSQSRVQLWSDWLQEFREHPVAGVGRVSGKDEETGRPGQAMKHVAHNSYLQVYADIGVVGGVLFLGAFVLALWTLVDRRAERTLIVDPEMRRLQPYLVGIVAAYAVGMLSLSLSYMAPTFSILALAAVFSRMVICWPPVPEIRFDGRVAAGLAVVNVAFLVGLYGFVRLFNNQ